MKSVSLFVALVSAIAWGFAFPTAEDSREAPTTIENYQIAFNRSENATWPDLLNGLPDRHCHQKWYQKKLSIIYNSIPCVEVFQAPQPAKGWGPTKIGEFRPNCDLECINVHDGFGSIQQHSSSNWGNLRCDSFADEYCQDLVARSEILKPMRKQAVVQMDKGGRRKPKSLKCYWNCAASINNFTGLETPIRT